MIDRPQLAIARGARRVLELGCGTGRLLAQVDARVRVGIDISLGMLRQAPAGVAHVACADAHALPFADRSFDAIIAGKGTFRYLDYERAFAECARVLAGHGHLAVHQYAAAPWSVRRLARARSAADRLHVTAMRELIEPGLRAGLEVRATYRWRSIRVWPYAVPVPGWIPGRLWSHCTVIFHKPAAPKVRRSRRDRH